MTLTNASPGSWIRYTLDGTTPTADHGLTNWGFFQVNTNTTVTAKSFNASGSSAQSQADFYIGKSLMLACGSTTNASLAATNAALVPGGALYNTFFRDAQTAVDSADSVNYAVAATTLPAGSPRKIQ